MNHVLVLIIIAFISCLISCSTTPDLPRGENALVRLDQYDVKTGALDLEIVLVEENHRNYQNIYNMTRDKASIKQVPAEKYEYLVASLEDLGFMDFAKPWDGGVPQQGTFKSISVENENGRWIFTIFKLPKKTTEEILEGRRQFKLMDQTVRSCYDSVLSLQVITNEGGGNLFLEEQRRLQELNKKVEQGIKK